MADATSPASDVPAILIVDDHAVVRAALQDWFCTVLPGFRVLVASSGEDALPLVEAERPRIVVMDISLPGISGIEATRRIKSGHPHVKVVILSVHEEPYYQAEARAANADAYVFKRDMHLELIPVLAGLLASDTPSTDCHPVAGASPAVGD